MTAGPADGLLIVRARVLSGGWERQAYVQVSGLPWGKLPVAGRKAAVREAKMMLLRQGALCGSCAGLYDATPPPCTLCSPVSLEMADGSGEYPITGDMLRVYSMPAWFSLIAAQETRRTVYASLEVAGFEWLQTPAEHRHRLMQTVVDKLLRLYPETGPDEVCTFIWDGQRENPYPFNWAAVPGDQAG